MVGLKVRSIQGSQSHRTVGTNTNERRSKRYEFFKRYNGNITVLLKIKFFYLYPQ